MQCTVLCHSVNWPSLGGSGGTMQCTALCHSVNWPSGTLWLWPH